MTNIIPFDIKERSKVTQEQQPIVSEKQPVDYIIQRLMEAQQVPPNTTIPVLQYLADVDYLLSKVITLSRLLVDKDKMKGDENNE